MWLSLELLIVEVGNNKPLSLEPKADAEKISHTFPIQ